MKMVPNKLSINQPKMQNGFSEEKIRRLCEAYQMSCNFVDGMIFIQTKIVKWRIYHKGERVFAIYHQNYRIGYSEACKRRKKFSEGFHRQDVNYSTVEVALGYIYGHDKNFLERKDKKTVRMEELFELIENGRKQKAEAAGV